MNNVMKTSQNYLINITDIIIQVLWHHTVCTNVTEKENMAPAV